MSSDNDDFFQTCALCGSGFGFAHICAFKDPEPETFDYGDGLDAAFATAEGDVMRALKWAQEELQRTRAELAATKAELRDIRAERERAQARLLGHPAYGEGAVCDGPGTPHASDLRELTDAVGKLVAKLSPTLAAIGVARTCVYCGEESRATLLQMRSEGSHVCICPRCFKEETAKAG